MVFLASSLHQIARKINPLTTGYASYAKVVMTFWMMRHVMTAHSSLTIVLLVAPLPTALTVVVPSSLSSTTLSVFKSKITVKKMIPQISRDVRHVMKTIS